MLSDPLGAFHQLRSELNECARMSGLWDDQGRVREWAWAVFGSGAMRLHGVLDRPLGDLDVFVQPKIWLRCANHPGWSIHLPDPAHPPYVARIYAGLQVHCFYGWRNDEPIRPTEVLARATKDVHGWNVARLEDVLAHKVYSVGRYHDSDRHLQHRLDIAVLRAHLAGER